MKRNRTINILAFFMMVLVVQAQELKVPKPYHFYNYNSLGLRMGAVYSTISLQPSVSDITPETSYSAGLVYIFSNKKYVGLQIELLYSQRKWKETFVDGTATTDLKFLEIPLMTNINLGNERLKYIINLGTYVSFKLDKSLKMNIPYENPYFQSIKDRQERNSDFGLLVGGAIRYISHVGIFQLDARYAYGFQKIYNEEATGLKFSNMSGINLALIYTINFSKK